MLPVDHVTIERFSELTGYSEFAVRSKIKRGDWRQDEQFFKAPDGRILMSLEGYAQWVTKGVTTKGSGSGLRVASASTSSIKASVAANGSSSSPPPLT
ncbi:excisionase [Vreelandella titanicae]|uniref:excisionase n=1 Tax=Vreelandella titanicae TaxID=664683 RepID=UPI003BAF171D